MILFTIDFCTSPRGSSYILKNRRDFIHFGVQDAKRAKWPMGELPTCTSPLIPKGLQSLSSKECSRGQHYIHSANFTVSNSNTRPEQGLVAVIRSAIRVEKEPSYALRRADLSIFKPSGITWRLGKCDQTEHFQAKWNHLAARKMRPNRAFSSQVESLGGSENATRQGPSAC